MWPQKSHTQPPMECQRQAEALLVLNKGDSSQSSLTEVEIGVAVLTPVGTLVTGSRILKKGWLAATSVMCKNRAAKSQGAGVISWVTTLGVRVTVCLYVQRSDLHTLMAWSKFDYIVSEETVQLSSVSHLLLLHGQNVPSIHVASARWQRCI